MAKNDKVRLDCRALPYLEPVTRLEVTEEDLGAAFLASGSRSPARLAVEARSDLAFVREVEESLRNELATDLAVAEAMAVLARPTLAARLDIGGGSARILQSVVLERTADDFDIQVTAHLTSHPGKPGSITLDQVAATLVDLEDHAELCSLVEAVECWWGEYPMPTLKVPEPFPLRDWAFLGEPAHVGLLDTPSNWRELLERAGAVYGVKPLVVDSAERMRAWSLEDRVEHTFVLRGTKWASTFPPETSQKTIEVVQLGTYGDTFADVLAEVRSTLLTEALAANALTPTSRELERNEVIYHRKVGNSRKFDRFDAGSTEPCGHGAEGFKGWGGDKAIKGMQRRYTNFTPDMLIHCDRFPNCGMYGVDAARGGHK